MAEKGKEKVIIRDEADYHFITILRKPPLNNQISTILYL